MDSSRFHPRYAVRSLLFARLKRIIQSELLHPGERVLDYGCGDQPYRALFATKFSEYLGADLPGNRRADLTLGLGGELPLTDSSVDCILSTQVLEHAESAQAYLAEAYRVLKPGGAIVLSTHGIWMHHPDPKDYWRWTLDGLQLEVGRAGFRILLIESVLGMASCAVQLWQDATSHLMPQGLRPAYIWVLQSIILLLEPRNRKQPSANACVYIVLGHKPDDVQVG